MEKPIPDRGARSADRREAVAGAGETAAPPPVPGARLTLAVLGPFAFGYFLSYLLRNVNAVVSPDLVETFGLDASDLGLLTSTYFLTFALFQPLLGVLLDRFGPRRVEGSLLLVAAAGCLIFAWSGGTALLIVGRALIGLGVSACLMAAFQANALWFSWGRLTSMNGWVLAAGGIGAVFSTAPVEWALQWMSWRWLFTLFALSFALGSALLFWMVPERAAPGAGITLKDQFRGFGQIARNREFWRIAPLTMLSQAVYMSLQGLWAAGWMRDVAGHSREEIAGFLLLQAVAMAAGYLFMGSLGSRLMRLSHAPAWTVGAGIGVTVVIHGLLACGFTGLQPLIWLGFGFLGTTIMVNFTLLTQAFPVAMAGRANTALNLTIFVGSFLVQWGMGAVVNRFPAAAAGHYAPEGYTLAFGAAALLQALALGWYIWRLPQRP
jgi:MFS family permease